MKRRSKAVEVVGVVHPIGAGGGCLGGETLWTMRFRFAAWRPAGGPIDERTLKIEQPGLPREQLDAATAGIKPYQMLRVRLRFTTDPLVAELVEQLGPDKSDKELAAVARKLKKPVTVAHPTLGTLTLDRRFDLWLAHPDWLGRPAELCLPRSATDEPALFDAAARLWTAQKKWDARVRACAAEKLLELKNGLWLGETEKPFTARRFKERMVLEGVRLDPDGSFEFTYADGNLFWGHAIQVWGSLSGGPTDAGIAG